MILTDNNKNDENFMTNYYEEIDKTDKKADKKISFKTEEIK